MNTNRLFLMVGVFLSWMTMGYAASASTQGGVIRFLGSIVEDTCTVSIVSQTTQAQCGRNGTNQRSLKTINTSSARLPSDMGTTKLQWINQQKTLGVVTVTYN
ncbi:type 1 fimbrial protein [Edaphovirga cremea]|uniref:type 1 fimbrial protein n=1 Tax=Edaphovirga cremea TaxID=2267246 RepID=UPI000DEEB030|nr:type 1 fimbrial protein [Edaphovirga cremea]